MNKKEKEILENLEKDNSPMEFVLFKEENNANDFSLEFHKKFDELENQINFEYNLRKEK